MTQTDKGKLKQRETMIAKHGSEEAWKEYLRQNAKEGGKAKNPNKGTGSLSPEERKRRSKLAAAKRWENHEKKG